MALPASVPRALIALHFAVQLFGRPLLGHRSDTARRTPWILGGFALLMRSGTAAAWSATLLQQRLLPGLLVASVAFIGLGAGGSSRVTCTSASSAPNRSLT